MKKCVNCGKELLDSAKFCRYCGTSVPEPTVQNIADEIETSSISGYVLWKVQEGQLAVRISEDDFISYKDARGVIIQEGVKALLFVEGKLLASLPAGKYTFKEAFVQDTAKDKTKRPSAPKEDNGTKKGFWASAASAVSRVFSLFTNAIRKPAEAIHGIKERIKNGPKQNIVSVVLVREADFSLAFDYENIPTANIRSTVGLNIRAKVTNANDFYAALLLDRQFVSFDSLRKTIEPLSEAVIIRMLNGVDVDSISLSNRQLCQAVLNELQIAVAEVFPFIAVNYIITLSAANEELEKIRVEKERLYVSEITLEELQKKNDFLNRFQDVTNAQELKTARTKVDFEKLMEDVNEDGLINEDDKEEFLMLLMAEKFARECKNEDEKQSLILEYRKKGILREEEMETLQREIQTRAAIADIRDSAEIEKARYAADKTKREEDYESRFAELRHQKAYAKEEYEADAGLRFEKTDDEIEMLRKRDAYSDERRDKEANYKDARRAAETQFQTERIENSLALKGAKAKLAYEIHKNNIDLERLEKEVERAEKDYDAERENKKLDAEQRRNMETKSAERQHELDLLNAKNIADWQRQQNETELKKYMADKELQKQQEETALKKLQAETYKNMSFEQIMAANPNISAEAARALAEISNRENIAAQSGQEEIKALQERLVAQAENDKKWAAEQAEKDKAVLYNILQQMSGNMSDIAQMQAQAKHSELEKEKESAEKALEKQRADTTKELERFSDGINNAVTNVAGAFKQPPIATVQQRNLRQETNNGYGMKKCPKCGTVLPADADFCDHCGQML